LDYPQPGTTAQQSGHWVARNWVQSDYRLLAKVAAEGMDIQKFQDMAGKSKQETLDAFEAIVSMPLWGHVVRAPGVARGGEGEVRTRKYLEATKKLSELMAAEDAQKLEELKARAYAELGEEMKKEAEAAAWAKIEQEGWVKVESAKQILSQHAPQLSTTSSNTSNNSSSSTSSTSGKSKDLDKLIKDAIDNLAKLQKEKDRKEKAAAKKEGKTDGEKKVSRPKKI
jgi:hypothetical protein